MKVAAVPCARATLGASARKSARPLMQTLLGLLVAGDLFADCGLAHLSLCIEGTGAHIALASIGRPGGDGSGKAAQENIFASIPESAGNRPLTAALPSPPPPP